MLLLQYLLDLWGYLPRPPYIGSYYMDVLHYLKFMWLGVVVFYVHVKLRQRMLLRQRLNYPPVRLNIRGEIP